jgi:glycosyltransferase involved in cell wall biosynthesis
MNKILLVSKLPPPYYGTTIWTQILLNSTLSEEFKLIHFNNNTHKNFTSLGKPNIVKALHNILLYFKFAGSLIETKPDMVFIPISQTTAGFIKDSIYVIISSIFRKKILLILHGSDFMNWMDHSPWLIRNYTGSVLKQTKGIVVLGNNLKKLFNDFYPDDRIFVVPNGGNYSFPFRISGNSIRLLFLANLIPSKGIFDVLESLIILKKYHESLIFDIAGVWFEDDIKYRCIEIVEKNNLPVIFHGQVIGAFKYQLLSDSDIFIFPPKAPEGHPYVIVEAMAAGLPIISTDQGAIIESVRDGVNGYIVEPGKPEQIAKKIQYLIEHPEIRLAMARESRRLYEENFTEEKMIGKLTQTFNSILES